MSTVNKQFISHFVSERKKLGLNQAAAAEKCGISLKMWGLYERGENVPSGEVLIKFQALGADIAFIFSGAQPLQLRQDQADYGESDKERVLNAYAMADDAGRAALLAVALIIIRK